MKPSVSQKIEVVVRDAHDVAENIRLLEFEKADGATLPGFLAGDHIGVTVAPGLSRSYSLLDAPHDAPASYRIAVALAPESRGGSQALHHAVRKGTELTITAPSSGFPVDGTAGRSIFIAGGIGITPILSAVRFLSERDRPWELHYAAGSRARAAFIAELTEAADGGTGRVNLYLGDEGTPRLNVTDIVSGAAADTHVYCCGPTSLIEDFVAATAHRRPETVHIERFANENMAAAGGFVVELARSGHRLQVDTDESILDVVLDAGVDVDFSCMEGICGSCRVSVLSGKPDHRDSYLSKAEKAAGDTMIICCSGTDGDHIVLDI